MTAHFLLFGEGTDDLTEAREVVMTLIRHLTHELHEHEFVVVRDPHGWDIREMEDSHVLRHVHHDDWHRVERDTRLFELRAIELKNAGWVES